MPAQADVEERTDVLKICCGQPLVSSCDHKHTLCDGEEDAYRVGGLTMELEGCPHRGCGAHFFCSPSQNLQHQDTIHWVILAYICSTCLGICVSKETFIHHMIHGHNGPTGFEKDMNEKYGGCFCMKVSYNY